MHGRCKEYSWRIDNSEYRFFDHLVRTTSIPAPASKRALRLFLLCIRVCRHMQFLFSHLRTAPARTARLSLPHTSENHPPYKDYLPSPLPAVPSRTQVPRSYFSLDRCPKKTVPEMIVQHLPAQPPGKLVGQVSLFSENTLF